MADLTAFQRDVLFAIASLDSPNGQDIRTNLGNTQDRTVRSGHIYLNLEELIDAGLIEKTAKNGRSNTYMLTDDGQEWLQNRLQWQATHVNFDWAATG